MTTPTWEDFKAHALALAIKHSQPGTVSVVAEGIEFGYKMALRHAAAAVKDATEELVKFRNKNNSPQ